MYAKFAVLAILAVSVNAGFFDDVSGVSSDVGNFFSSSFKSVKDLFVNDQSELEKNVQRVKDLLTGVKDKIKMLEPMANDAQKETLRNVDTYLAKISNFQTDVKAQGEAKFQENKGKWQQMVSDIFEKGGLSSVLKLLNINSAPSFTYAAVIAPIIYMVFFN